MLGALADVRSDSSWLDPDPIRLVRDRVHLSGQLRNPEAVRHVDRLNGDERRRRSGGVADGDMDLIGGDDTELWIADLPPPLIADDGDLERVRRLRAALEAPDVPCGDEEQDHDDEKRD